VALLRIEAVELQRLALPADAAWLGEELGRTVAFGDGPHACPLESATPVAAGEALVVLRLRFACSAPLVAPRISVRLLFGQSANPLHYARITRGRYHQEALLTRSEDTVEVSGGVGTTSALATLGRYLRLGFEHILAGLDHVAFLLCMLLVSPRLGQRVWMVTGFTLGHSLTLSLATLGLIRVETAGVEALIGFTVALLALEVLQHRGRSLLATGLLLLCIVLLSVPGIGSALPARSLVALAVLTPAYLLIATRTRSPAALHLGMTAAFGLVHGLGFASVLLAIGLPPGQQPWALAGFNLGVELGQLALLLAAGLAGAVFARRVRADAAHAAGSVLATGLCCLGVFWFVGRSLS